MVASAFAASVAESALTGPGAGGFILVRPPDGPAVVHDAFAAAPGLGPGGRRLRPEMLDAFTVPFGDAEQVFHIGPASVAVPGFYRGLFEVWEHHGRLPLSDLVQPAVALAIEGVVLSPEVSYLHTILREMLTWTPGAAAIYAPGGALLGTGDRLRMPRLAETLTELARTGCSALDVGGWLSSRLVDGLTPLGGLVTADDIAAYRVIPRTPWEVAFRGHRVLTNPPPSSGGVLIGAALATMDARPATADPVARACAMVDAGHRANGLRCEEFVERLGEPGFTDWFRERLGRGDGGSPSRGPAGTTHVSVIDADGMIASTSSSNGAGSGVVIDDLGFLLNNMLGEEDLNPGGFGRVEPGRRLTSMMAPTVILTPDGHPRVVIGSAGSNRLRSAILQTTVNILDGGMDGIDAVEAPRLHVEGGGVDVEGGVPEPVVQALDASGYALRRWGGMNLFFGGVNAVGRESTGLWGAGDPRRGGAAAAVNHRGEVIALSPRP